MQHAGKVTVRITSLADIVLLRPESDCVHRQTVWRKEPDLFAVFAQLEVRMQIGGCAVGGRIIRPDQKITSGTNDRSHGQRPLLLLAQIVGQVKAGKINGDGPEIVQFKPVLVFARGWIDQIVRVRGKPFVDNYWHRRSVVRRSGRRVEEALAMDDLRIRVRTVGEVRVHVRIVDVIENASRFG